jgi:MoaA/NifB/PqqE/SkfB family radical SAM enzyme
MIKNVHIETSSRCNARCSFCPHSKMTRAKEVMSDQVFSQVVEDMRGWYRGPVYPFFMGEMFLDPDIFGRMDRLAGFVSGFNIFTNGSLLNEGRLEALSTYRIGSFHISLQAVRKDQHAMLTGLKNWEHILAMVRQIQPKLGVKPWLVFNDYLEPGLCKQLADQLGGQMLMAHTYTWRGAVNSHHKRIPQSQCEWLNGHVFILSSGEVVPCCMDCEGQASAGNVMDAPIREIYKGFAHLRKPRSQVEFCKACNMP